MAKCISDLTFPSCYIEIGVNQLFSSPNLLVWIFLYKGAPSYFLCFIPRAYSGNNLQHPCHSSWFKNLSRNYINARLRASFKTFGAFNSQCWYDKTAAWKFSKFPPAPYHKKQMCSQVDDCLATKRQYFGPFRLNNSVFLCACCRKQKTRHLCAGGLNQIAAAAAAAFWAGGLLCACIVRAFGKWCRSNRGRTHLISLTVPCTLPPPTPLCANAPEMRRCVCLARCACTQSIMRIIIVGGGRRIMEHTRRHCI